MPGCAQQCGQVACGVRVSPAKFILTSYRSRETKPLLGIVSHRRTPAPQRIAQGEPKLTCYTGVRAASVDAPSAVEAPKDVPHAAKAYDWNRQWYPLAYVHDLDPGRPHPMELLGKRLVLWRDSSGEWHCFQDRCPHRLAPLSEGRIDSNGTTLMCSYHGWEFNGDGKCVRIPQAVDPKAHEVACASSRSSATTFPVQVKQGMVWIWGDASPTAYIDSAATPPLLLPEIDEHDGLMGADGTEVLDLGKRYARDVDYSWSILVENVMDYSHASFAHHGVIGSRYADGAGDVDMSPTVPGDPSLFNTEGFSMDASAFLAQIDGRKSEFKIQFLPPCLVRNYFPNGVVGNRSWTQMPMYIVPTAPGKSRILWSLVMPKNRLPLMLQVWSWLTPVWLDHLTRNAVFDGDATMLHMAERTLAQQTGEHGQGWRQAYYMPAPADRVVIAFRQWLESRGGPPKADNQLGPANCNKHEHLDRWNQHTKHCKSCMKAVKTLEALRIAAAVAGVLAVMSLVVLALSRGNFKPLVPALVAAGGVLAGIAWSKLGSLIQQFYYVPYDHQAMN